MRSGKGLVAIGVAIVAIIGGVGVYLSIDNRPKPDVVHQIIAIDANAALVRRGVKGAERRQFLEYYDVERGSVWHSLIRRPVPVPYGLTPVVSAAGAISIRSLSHDVGQIVVFRADDGKKMGRQLQHSPDGDVQLPDDAAIALDGKMSYDFYRDGDRILIIATDLWAGHEDWRTHVDGGNAGPVWPRGSRLLVFHAGTISSIDAANGRTVASLAVRGRPCVTGDAVYAVIDGVLTATNLDLANPRPIAIEGATSVWSCGRRGDDVVLVMDRAVVALDAATLAERWLVSLGRYTAANAAGDDYRRRVPWSAPVSGQLTRFVPIQVRDGDDASAQAIAMLDVDEGTLAWTSQTSGELVGDVVRVGDHHYFIKQSPVLVAELDGASGTLTAAIRVDADERMRWSQIVDRHVWVSRGVDLEVIELGAPHPWATDVRSQLAASLGLPES